MPQDQLNQIRKKYPKIAIVHDWLYGGGAEQVVYELHKMFPDAPIYTSYCNDAWRRKLDGKVITGFLQYWPFDKLRKFLPILRIWWFTQLDLSDYDLIISSSGNGEAKGVKVSTTATHILYCHSPTHFYWRHYKQYMQHPGFGIFNFLARFGLKLLVGPLRKWDYAAAQRPDYIIANSTHIQQDIKEYYGRDSVVIYPPVSTERFQAPPTTPPASRRGFVAVGRQVPFKRFDLIVRACTQLGVPLTVVGGGPEHENLRRLAGPSVTFVTREQATDEVVVQCMQAAQAFIFASHEDFGITPIEALAAGTPVIAYRAGGAIDYIQPGINGEFFEEQSVDSLCTAIRSFDVNHYDNTIISQSAQRFSTDIFFKAVRDFLNGL